MLVHPRIRALVVCALLLGSSQLTRAQSATRLSATDPRWYAWLGCWAADADETGEQSTSSSATCIVPIAGSSAVEALTVARHKVVARDRLDSSRPHALDGQGCQGMEAVNWSQTNRRVFVRSDYACSSGVRGTSNTLFAISLTGEWLRIEEVRSGNGSTTNVARLRDIGLLSVVTPDAARSIEARRREIIAARAAAAAAITAEELADATYALNGSVVRAWVFAADQRFNVDTRELAALARADLPLSVLQTLAAVAEYQAAPFFSAPGNDGNVYMNSSSVNVAPQVAQNPYYDGYPCSPLNCLNPYSPFNGFGSPFGYPLTFVSTDRGFNRGGSRRGGHDGKGHSGFRGNAGVIVRPFGLVGGAATGPTRGSRR